MVAGLQQFARVPVRLERAQSSLTNSQASTTQTVQVMCGHIRRDRNSSQVRRVAADILKAAGAGASDPYQLACAVWLWVKCHVRFEQDDVQIARLLNESDQLELLIAPAALIDARDPAGDCDDFTMLVCALCSALGLRAQIVTICCDPENPARFSHVYARAMIAPGQWLALDASHGTAPGWKVPAVHTSREMDWDINGNCAADILSAHRPAAAAAIKTAGLGDFNATSTGLVFVAALGLALWVARKGIA